MEGVTCTFFHITKKSSGMYVAVFMYQTSKLIMIVT